MREKNNGIDCEIILKGKTQKSRKFIVRLLNYDNEEVTIQKTSNWMYNPIEILYHHNSIVRDIPEVQEAIHFIILQYLWLVLGWDDPGQTRDEILIHESSRNYESWKWWIEYWSKNDISLIRDNNEKQIAIESFRKNFSFIGNDC